MELKQGRDVKGLYSLEFGEHSTRNGLDVVGRQVHSMRELCDNGIMGWSMLRRGLESNTPSEIKFKLLPLSEI